MNDVPIATGDVSQTHQIVLQNNTSEAIQVEPSAWVQHEPVSAGQEVTAHVVSPGETFSIALRVRKKTVGNIPANHAIPHRHIDGGEGPQFAVIKLNNGVVYKKLRISLAGDAWFGDARSLTFAIDDLDDVEIAVLD